MTNAAHVVVMVIFRLAQDAVKATRRSLVAISRRGIPERLVRPLFVVQQRLRTPTGPFFARFFIGIILGLVAEFALMGPSTRLGMSFFAARWMGRKQIVGLKYQHGCSTGRHALTPGLWQLSRLSTSTHLQRSLRFSIWR